MKNRAREHGLPAERYVGKGSYRDGAAQTRRAGAQSDDASQSPEEAQKK